jgi:fibronectin-binding autotransporter adhesin
LRDRFYPGIVLAVVAFAVAGPSMAATRTWDGQGADASWANPTNWDGNTLPAFDGTDNISVGTGFASGATLTLDGDRSVRNFIQTTATDITYSPGTPADSKLVLMNGCLTNVAAARSQTHNEAVVLGTSGTFNVGSPGATYFVTINGPISENTPNCSITKSGVRPLVLNGTNTFSGGVFHINSGSMLVLGNDRALGSGTLRINASTLSTLPAVSITNNVDIYGSFTFGSGSYKGLTLNPPGVVTLKSDASITVSPNANTDNLVFNNGITDDGTPRSLTFLGSNRGVFLNAASTFSGAFTLGGPWITIRAPIASTNVAMNAGILYVAIDNPIGTGTVTASKGVYTICSTSAPAGVRFNLDNVFLWQGTNQGGNGFAGVDYNRNGGSSTLIGDFVVGYSNQSTGTNSAPWFRRGLQESGGSWGLRILGAADRWVVLNGPSSYSGPTVISHGNLRLMGTHALPTNTDVNIAFTAATDGVLDLGGTSHRIGSLSGDGSVKLGAGTLTVGGSSDTTFAGYISGSHGILAREGSGILRLNTTNLTYTSYTRVQGGTLQVDGLMPSATGTVEVTGGTLGGTGRINRAVNVRAGGTIQAGWNTNLLGTLTIGGTLGLSNGATVAWAVDAVTNSVVAVTNKVVQEGAVIVKVANLGRTILPEEQFVLLRFTNSLVGFNATNWSFDFSESPETIGSVDARVATNAGVIYATGLKAPFSSSAGTVFYVR